MCFYWASPGRFKQVLSKKIDPKRKLNASSRGYEGETPLSLKYAGADSSKGFCWVTCGNKKTQLLRYRPRQGVSHKTILVFWPLGVRQGQGLMKNIKHPLSCVHGGFCKCCKFWYDRLPLVGILYLHETQERLAWLENVTRASTAIRVSSNKKSEISNFWVNYPFEFSRSPKSLLATSTKEALCRMF